MKHNKTNRGFTLIEVLISLSIVTIILLSLFSFYNSSIKFNKKNETDINSLNVSQTAIESMRIYSKLNNKFGIDIDNDGVDDLGFDNSESNWVDLDSEYKIYTGNLDTLEIEKDNNKYLATINSVKRYKNNMSVYTVELETKSKYNSTKKINLITQVYVK
ncbi:MAG: prepilin-type N-terminal cleavage/methylation domain-containing protein [Peptostreptococcaceae bacterium]|nr:prepilin-type N-terminal cleavage/methylation domain-containing protein [Peptostreptococcaceae bacterium]MDU4933709.1 prepilin-type N-terminal cleavage/methylation domain-containing protein [Peptostreptococcaceae bacterium]